MDGLELNSCRGQPSHYEPVALSTNHATTPDLEQ